MRHAHFPFSSARLAWMAALVFAAMMFSQGVLACTITNWSTSSGSPTAGDPTTAGGEVARYAGLCAMEVNGQSFVQDNNPGGINRIISRFYVLVDPAQFSGAAEVYAGFSANDGSDKLFSVTVDDAGNVTLTDTATGTSISGQGTTNWISVEVDWVQGAGSGELNLIVNGTAATPATGLGNAGNPLTSVRLGNLDGGGSGPLTFDAYESRRSTAIGRLMVADANSDASMSTGDIVVVRNELLDSGRASGTPDCNEDGSISTGDIVCIRNILLGP